MLIIEIRQKNAPLERRKKELKFSFHEKRSALLTDGIDKSSNFNVSAKNYIFLSFILFTLFQTVNPVSHFFFVNKQSQKLFSSLAHSSSISCSIFLSPS